MYVKRVAGAAFAAALGMSGLAVGAGVADAAPMNPPPTYTGFGPILAGPGPGPGHGPIADAPPGPGGPGPGPGGPSPAPGGPGGSGGSHGPSGPATLAKSRRDTPSHLHRNGVGLPVVRALMRAPISSPKRCEPTSAGSGNTPNSARRRATGRLRGGQAGCCCARRHWKRPSAGSHRDRAAHRSRSRRPRHSSLGAGGGRPGGATY